MVKHTQTICPQQPTNCLNVFNHFLRLAVKGLGQTFSAWCPLKGHTYLKSKPASFSWRFV